MAQGASVIRVPPLTDEPMPRPSPGRAHVWRLTPTSADDAYAALSARGHAVRAEIDAAISRTRLMAEPHQLTGDAPELPPPPPRALPT